MSPRRIGRYLVFDAFAQGGTATVHLARLVADRGFSRVVAIKMLARTPGGSSLPARTLEDEARVMSRIRHPNVVQPLDFVDDGESLLVVMEYIHGVSLARLLDRARERQERLAPSVITALLVGALDGLHAAHQAVDEEGRPLGIVHRDVSPQNILVGADGVARLADFGVAKVMRREEHTATGIVKGKPSYMAPEQLRGLPLTRQADLYAAGIVLAEAFAEPIEIADVADLVATATHAEPRKRFATAAQMSAALATAVPPATSGEVAAVVEDLVGDDLDRRSALVRDVESALVGDVESVRETSAPSAPPPARVRSWPRALVFVLGAAGAVGIGLVATAPRRTPPPPSPPVAASSEPPDPESAVEPPAGDEAGVYAPPGLASARIVRPRTRVPRSAKTDAGAMAPPDCTPPYRIDATGNKHYKPECVK